MVIIVLEYVNNSLKTHLFNTVREVLAEYFKRILRVSV
jgi:hypothetical protein